MKRKTKKIQQKPEIDDMKKYIIDKACEASRFYSVVCKTVEDSRNFIRQILRETQGKKSEIDEKFIEKWRGILEENGDIEYYEGIPNVTLDDEDIKKMLIEAGLKIIREARGGKG